MAKPQNSSLRAATDRVHEFEGRPLEAKFLERGLEVLTMLAARLDATELDAAIASPTSPSVLVTAMSQPGAIGIFQGDALLPARLKGLRARDEILAAEGGTLDANEVAKQLGIAREEVEERRTAGKLLAVPLQQGHGYPAWQFVGSMMLPGVEEILALLAEHPPLAQIRFFLSGNTRLGGRRPLDALRRGEIDTARRAARMFGEQGAA